MSHASTWPLAALVALAAGAMPRSVYTPLTPDACTTVAMDDGGSAQRCPGTAGYALLIYEDDLHQTVDVVASGGAAYPLDYWSVVTSAFSVVGERAEWRVEGTGRRARPVALTVRVTAQTGEEPVRYTSMLAVARVSAAGACVTDVILASADMNARARRAADRSAGRPCLVRP